MYTPEEIKNHLGRLIAQAMYMDVNEIQEDQLFSSFGLESVTLVKVLQKINDTYSCAIEIKELLPYQTLREASSFVYEKIASQSLQLEEGK